MIDLKFGLFWSSEEMSYLRYLTFKSLRYHHPDSEIELYISKNSKKDGFHWGNEQQDFQSNDFEQMVNISELEKLNVKIKTFEGFENYAPNFQSDIFRWWWIKENGGFYLDNDQIILKSFESLDRDCDFILTKYLLSWGAEYFPVGAVAGSNESDLVNYVHEILPKYYNPSDYNCLGPWGFRSIYNSKKWKSKISFIPSHYFYPVPESQFMPIIYDNNVKLHEEAYCLHWFGGLKRSQQFSKSFTKKSAEKNNDTISKILRENNFFEG